MCISLSVFKPVISFKHLKEWIQIMYSVASSSYIFTYQLLYIYLRWKLLFIFVMKHYIKLVTCSFKNQAHTQEINSIIIKLLQTLNQYAACPKRYHSISPMSQT